MSTSVKVSRRRRARPLAVLDRPTVTPAVERDQRMERTPTRVVVEEMPVIEMVEPMPGFPERRRFALVRLDEEGVLCALSSLDEPGLRFLVVPPAPFFPDYAPEVDDAAAGALGLAESEGESAVVLLVVNPGAGPAEATANLLAPVVVNPRTRRAAQVVLDADLPVRARLIG